MVTAKSPGTKTLSLVLLVTVTALIMVPEISAATTAFKTSSLTLRRGGSGVINLTLNQAPNGLRKFQVSLQLNNDEVANFGSVMEGAIPLQVLSNNNDLVELRGADLEKKVEQGAENIRLATITVNSNNTGESNIILEVDKSNTINDEGNVLTYSLKPGSITIGENKKPTPKFQVSPSQPQVEQPVELDAGGSSDPDGNIVEYHWDLNEDGVYEESGEKVTKQWSSSGSRLIKLRVVDSEGAEETLSKSITIGSTQEPPQARFSYYPSTVTVGTTVQFDGSDSSDPDGGYISEYEWDVDGDGSYEKSGKTVTFTYDSSGSKTVALRVTDDDGSSDTTQKYINVEGEGDGGDQAPTAQITTSPSRPDAGEMIEFSAAGSDPHDAITEYEWDLDGDGSYEKSGEAVTYTYQQGGRKTVKLKVTDNSGQSDTQSKTLDLGSGGGNGGGGSNFPWIVILLILVVVVIGVVLYLSMVPEEGKEAEEDYELSPLE